ncbi:hypothetical protein KTC96_24800 (plasmid) [Clostridium estertheticum]|uniref:hypothetical protein n=1 Tax=Clostridium estertheticum TaxID=238834 RepID=UPI001C7D5D1F|nr:hypothetical protein [Clostridium estertheticum]MBX4259748.1 hypothetical protein [Clostridium estertheticum]WLC73244.1 hypothetical protein KTC96_24800 [Clostridium estertheticum]
MFKYTEKVGELLTSYEADTAQGIVDLVNILERNNKCGTNPTLGNSSTDNNATTVKLS